MAKGTRITMTVAECETPTGKRLLNLILDICHDGELSIEEIDSLYQLLRYDDSGIPAVAWLRAFVREAILDGSISDADGYRLKKAFMRVVPKEVRGVIATHLEQIGAPAADPEDEEPRWCSDRATAKQIDYIIALGGSVQSSLTKGQASILIDQLLERRPVTLRQLMVLRFFNRLDLAGRTREEVSQWIDSCFW
ncbi:MAG TPA: hypothetical protein VG711_12470, partial [Phycisphaerales bacterium]|nr:hypothetical protein [Phycisphaerales bacterium]